MQTHEEIMKDMEEARQAGRFLCVLDDEGFVTTVRAQLNANPTWELSSSYTEAVKREIGLRLIMKGLV